MFEYQKWASTYPQRYNSTSNVNNVQFSTLSSMSVLLHTSRDVSRGYGARFAGLAPFGPFDRLKKQQQL